MSLRVLRNHIDNIDAKIISLLNDRIITAKKVASLKQRLGKSVYSPEREAEILKKLSEKNNGEISKEALESIYREIMSASLGVNKSLKIAYMGPEASFSNLAALKRFGSQVEYLACENISDVFLEVERKNADFGVVPIENSIEGAISHTLDMFVDSDLKICAQITLDISHNLLANCKKEQIKRVYSNPQVFGQCRLWLQENLPCVEKIEVSSTTRAAQIAAKEKQSACIASLLAAKLYKVKVLERNIEDSPYNATRFFVIGRSEALPTKRDKTSLLFSIKDRVGALHDMLVPFKKYSINLTKIESRPSKKKAWDYYFYIDLEGHHDDKKVKKALTELESKCKFLKVLGSYPIAE